MPLTLTNRSQQFDSLACASSAPLGRTSNSKSDSLRAVINMNDVIRYFATGVVIESKSDFHIMTVCLG
jgi:hypothetical protein